ncbi:DNA topology modulation protein [Bacillus sp. AK128]
MKIVLIGSGGAGKSTLARILGEQLNIEVIHLDAHFWKANWQQTPRPEWMSWQEEVIQRENWIIDGNYGSTMEVRLAAADVIIFLDFSRWICLKNIVKRRIMYHGKTRPDMAKGCQEKLDWEFIKWVYDYPKQKAPDIRKKLKELESTKEIFHLKNRKEIPLLLNKLKND